MQSDYGSFFWLPNGNANYSQAKKVEGGGGGVGVTSLLNVADRSYIMQKSIHVKRACDEQLYMFN